MNKQEATVEQVAQHKYYNEGISIGDLILEKMNNLIDYKPVTDLYRPVMFQFPAVIKEDTKAIQFNMVMQNSRESVKIAADARFSGNVLTWEFLAYNIPVNNKRPYVANPIVLGSIIWGRPYHALSGIDPFFKALKPGIHICPTCDYKQRYSILEQNEHKYKNRPILCPNDKTVMVYRHITSVNEDIQKQLIAMYKEGCSEANIIQPPMLYMLLANTSKAEWKAETPYLQSIRDEITKAGRDMVSWKLGKKAGEKPIGAMMVIPERRIGWVKESHLFNRENLGYISEFVYTNKHK